MVSFGYPDAVAVPAKHHIMEDAGQRLRRVRERLSLRFRDVEQASQKIADKYHNDEFLVPLSRLSDIENHGQIPNIFKLYSLATIYRLNFQELLEWYGVPLANMVADSVLCEVPTSHLVNYSKAIHAESLLPISLDPGIDVRRTTYLSRMIQRWGKIPLMLLDTLDLKDHRYGFIGFDDWFMYPLLQPGALVMLDETKRKIVNSGWANEFDRPIYFLEHRQGYVCGWCHQVDDKVILHGHPASVSPPQIFEYPKDIDVIGQVTGVAMNLDQARRRRLRP
ncbi:MAG TPA: helix-turn-helix transcriptional regulator [Bryobacteraceae bacterium]|nr:helix-turn-helix transcriptional regulator [Bryobacteraceae bacterium]